MPVFGCHIFGSDFPRVRKTYPRFCVAGPGLPTPPKKVFDNQSNRFFSNF